MTPLPYLSILKVSGADASRFLQAQLTAQLAGMEVSSATYSAYCSSKGQVIATLLVSPRDNHWLMVVESSLLSTLMERLQKYILREDVQLKPLADLSVFGVDPHDAVLDSDILLEPRSVPIRYAISGRQPVAKPEAMAHWQRSELVLGIPWLGQSSSEKFIPQMLGLDAIGAVSFSKGCFPGQEVIARARHLGQVKRRPLVLDIEGPTPPDPDATCLIQTSGGQLEARLVHCVATAATKFTIFAVAATQAGDVVRAVEQEGKNWIATGASLARD